MARIPKQTKKLKFDLSNVPRNKRKDVRNKIGKTLVDEILNATKSGKSPVSGESFDLLSVEYAHKNKGGNRTPNLRLSRDMTNGIDYKVDGTTVEVGIFNGSETAKAEGHNQFNEEIANPNLPKRRFIPGEEQNFKRDINTKINNIIKKQEGFKPLNDFNKSRKKKEQEERKQERNTGEEGRESVRNSLDLGQTIDDFIIETILRLRDGQ